MASTLSKNSMREDLRGHLDEDKKPSYSHFKKQSSSLVAVILEAPVIVVRRVSIWMRLLYLFYESHKALSRFLAFLAIISGGITGLGVGLRGQCGEGEDDLGFGLCTSSGRAVEEKAAQARLKCYVMISEPPHDTMRTVTCPAEADMCFTYTATTTSSKDPDIVVKGCGRKAGQAAFFAWTGRDDNGWTGRDDMLMYCDEMPTRRDAHVGTEASTPLPPSPPPPPPPSLPKIACTECTKDLCNSAIGLFAGVWAAFFASAMTLVLARI